MSIMRGEAPIPPEQSKNYVGDTPDQFKAWCRLNAGRVERAKSLPYFIRDNKDYYDAALNPKKAEELTPLEIAKYRSAKMYSLMAIGLALLTLRIMMQENILRSI